jgi:hypothetical protein
MKKKKFIIEITEDNADECTMGISTSHLDEETLTLMINTFENRRKHLYATALATVRKANAIADGRS